MNGFRFAGVFLTLLFVSSCASSSKIDSVRPGERPDVGSDEAGLWLQFDKLEQAVRSSGRVVTDPEINAYVRGVICKLAPAHCADIRFHIVRVPYMNASMAPNGYMEIWTGFLLRAQNEAQLAYVLGHELGHYLERHSIKRWRDLRGKTSSLAVMQVATAVAGAGYVGQVGRLVALSSLFAFSREQEREADTFGFDLMVRAGYDPGEAARIWERLVEEREAADEPETAIFFATHPHTSERIATLKKSAAATRAPGTRDAVNRAQYLAAVTPYRRQWLRDELRLRQPARTEVLLENLSVGGEESGDVHYALGETYRLRGDEGDLDKALAAYQQSIGAADTPPAVYRSLGLVYRRLERSEDAIRALQQYLAVKPDASDRKMIESMIKQAR